MSTVSSKSAAKTTSLLDNPRTLFYMSVGFMLVSVVLLVFALQAEHRSTANLRHVAVSQVPFEANQNINMGSATLRVSNVTYADGSAHFSAPAGMHYLILDLAVKNYSDKPINVLPASDTYVKASDGKAIYLTPYELASPFRSGELSPGEQITGQLSYLVPTAAKSLKFYVDAIWSGGVVPIAIK